MKIRADQVSICKKAAWMLRGKFIVLLIASICLCSLAMRAKAMEYSFSDEVQINVNGSDVITSQAAGDMPFVDSKEVPETVREIGVIEDVLEFSCGLAGIKINGLWGFVDTAMNIVIEPQYDSVQSFGTYSGDTVGYAEVSKDGKRGFINKNGHEVIPVQWDKIVKYANFDVMKVELGGKYGLIDIKGNIISEPQWDSISSFSGDVAIIQKGELFGAINTDGHIIIEPKWPEDRFHQGIGISIKGNDGYQWLLSDGQIIGEQYIGIGQFSEGLAWFRSQKDYLYEYVDETHELALKVYLCGYVDATGEVVIKPVWQDAFDFSEGMARVLMNRKYGYIDKNGNLTIPLVWDFAYDFKDGYAIVIKDDKMGVINKAGEAIVSAAWDQVQYAYVDYSDAVLSSVYPNKHLFYICQNEKWGLIDSSNRIIIEPQYERAPVYRGYGLFQVQNGLLGFVDVFGQEVMPPMMKRLTSFTDGLARFMQNGKWGYINTNCEVVIPPEYEMANSFGNGFASVCQDGKWYFIDPYGNKLLPVRSTNESPAFKDMGYQTNANDYTYEYFTNADGITTCTITGYTGTDTELVLPSHAPDGTVVTAIGWEAFGGIEYHQEEIEGHPGIFQRVNDDENHNARITSVTIPPTVTLIEDGAFEYCKSLKSIEIPDSVTEIGSDAFRNCESLTEIMIPDSVASLESFALAYCTSLEKAKISCQLDILNSTFVGCTSLTSIEVPSGVKMLSNTFRNCENLTHIDMSDSTELTSISRFTFYGCRKLQNVHIPDGVQSLGMEVFSGCTGLQTLSIPSSVTEIGADLFIGCTPGIKVYVDSGSYAEQYCAGLEGITLVRNNASEETPLEPDTTKNEDSIDALPFAYEIVRRYRWNGNSYYEANLLENYNGVSASNLSANTYFFMDDSYQIVTDAVALTKLYTMHMFAECKNIIYNDYYNWMNASQIWGKTSLNFMSEEQIFRNIGSATGGIVRAIYSGGASAIADTVNYILSNATDSDIMSSLLQMAFIDQQLNNLKEVSQDMLDRLQLMNDSSYNYDEIAQTLDLYKYSAVCYESARSVCIPIIEGILGKYESDWEVGISYLGELAKSATSSALPELKMFYTFFGMMHSGELSKANFISLLNDVLSLFEEYNIINYGLGYFSGALDAYETIYGVNADVIDRQYKITQNYYLSVDEMLNTQLYTNHCLLAGEGIPSEKEQLPQESMAVPVDPPENLWGIWSGIIDGYNAQLHISGKVITLIPDMTFPELGFPGQIVKKDDKLYLELYFLSDQPLGSFPIQANGNKMTLNYHYYLKRNTDGNPSTTSKPTTAPSIVFSNPSETDSQIIVKPSPPPISERWHSGTAQGFAGPVAVDILLDEQGAITDISIGDDSFCETMGFGMQALDDAFQAQFIGLIPPLELEDIDALSMATYTTNAVLQAINSAVEESSSLLKEE